jgi:hypothetical protein
VAEVPGTVLPAFGYGDAELRNSVKVWQSGKEIGVLGNAGR